MSTDDPTSMPFDTPDLSSFTDVLEPDGVDGRGEKGDDAAGQKNVVTDTNVGGDLSVENTTQLAESIFNGDFYYQIVESQRRTTVRQFTCSDGVEVTEAEEEVATRHMAGTEPQLAGLVRHLEERRVLLLTAEQGARKVTVATHLAAQLRRGGACSRAALLFDSLERHVRVDLPRLPLKHDGVNGRVVIFRYAFSRGNPDLAAAFEKTDRVAWEQLVERLRERGAYLVFTATPDEAERFREAPAFHSFARELEPHGRDLLALRFDERLEALERRGEEAAARAAVLRDHRNRLLESFVFAPRLHDFVEFFAGLEHPVPGLDDALARFHDGSQRLLHELDDDLDGWVFGFALALAHCTPDARGIPWIDFDRLRRHLRQWLERDLGRSREGGEEEAPGDLRARLSDTLLLTRSRATVEKDASTLADEIRFCDGKPSHRLWRVLLESYRGVLTGLVPRLRKLAEQPGENGRSLGVLTAQIIGRIGEIDPERVVVPLVDEWMRDRRGECLGPLYEGVMGSADPRYRARCLRHLKNHHAQAPAAGKGRLEAGIGVYSWVGYHDLPLAMSELFGISRAHLLPLVEDAQRMAELAGRVEAVLEAQAVEGSDALARALRASLGDLVDRVYAQRGGVILGVHYALVSLCGTRGVTPVLRELRGWIREAGAGMGVLLALMFLHERGIAHELQAQRSELSGDVGGSCGTLLLALTNGEGDVRQVTGFIADLYDGVSAPQAAVPFVRRLVRGGLEAHLQEWLREALPEPELSAAVRHLLQQLARTHGGMLRDVVMQGVTRGELARTPEMASFVGTLRL